MIKAIQPIAPASPALENPAVARCHEAMQRTLNACTINGEVLPFAYIDACRAYREAMPRFPATRTSAISSPAPPMACS
jgi:hypothetical protein